MLRTTIVPVAALLLWIGAPASAQNLLTNPDFDQDIAGWSCDLDGVCAWSEDDPDDDPASGSGQVTRAGAGAFRGQLVQCVELPVAGRYHVEGSLRTISDDPRNGQLDVAWFDEAGCGGSRLRLDIVGAVPTALGWTPLEAVLLAPQGAVSLEYRAIAFALETESQTVRVDTAFVPEPTAPLAGLAVCAALGALRPRRSGRARGRKAAGTAWLGAAFCRREIRGRRCADPAPRPTRRLAAPESALRE